MARGKKPRISISFYEEDLDPALWRLFRTSARNQGDLPGKVLSELMEEKMREIYGPTFERNVAIERRILNRRTQSVRRQNNEPEL